MEIQIARAVRISETSGHSTQGWDATAIYRVASGAVINIRVSGPSLLASATGFLISQNTIATCKHVVRGADLFEFTTLTGERIPCRISSIREDADDDCALIAFEPPLYKFPTLELQPSAPEVGETVYAIGNPLGEYPGTLTSGIVSAVRKTPDGVSTELQFTCPVTFGNSGSPLLNSRCQVVGIVAAQDKRVTAKLANVNFAVPTEAILRVLTQP
ncbi:MAG: serine protease Do [Fimbriimonadaceae bacterium]|nr:serine protease Do [Fimbriimonadaceae bacterium]